MDDEELIAIVKGLAQPVCPAFQDVKRNVACVNPPGGIAIEGQWRREILVPARDAISSRKR